MELIGQVRFKNKIQMLSQVPLMSLIIGPTGSGKTTCAKWVATQFGFSDIISIDNKVESVRSMIHRCYTVAYPTIYIIDDIDRASRQAVNSLLKITEEPPNKSFFILTASDKSNVLATIQSRAHIFELDPYTIPDIEAYAKISNISDDVMPYLPTLCGNLADVNNLADINIDEYFKYVKGMCDNMYNMSGVSLFKITSNLNFKDDLAKYDPVLFLKAFIAILFERYYNNINELDAELIKLADRYIGEFQKVGLNRLATFDAFLLEVKSKISEVNV